MSNGTTRLTDVGLLWLRLLMGLGIASHGYQKLFGGMMAGFTQGVAQMGFPAPQVFAWAAALSEFAGGLCLALGLGTRVAAGFVFLTMTTAVFVHHAADPFHVKELALAYWTMAGVLIFTGPGVMSAARLVGKR